MRVLTTVAAGVVGFTAMAGGALFFIHGPWFVLVGVTALFVASFGLWMHVRLNRVLGPANAELKRKAGVSAWNPLLDVMTYDLRAS
jgi:hypothetical protein